MRTLVAGETKIDVIAHISQEDLELDRLVPPFAPPQRVFCCSDRS